MLKDMREIATILDQTIEKSERVRAKERELVKGERLSIRKALSFDPTRISEMSPESQFYNPYRQMGDGSYAPHSPEHWAEQGRMDQSDAGKAYHNMVRNPDGYREADNMLNVMKSVIIRTADECIVKGRNLPIGTVHDYNGQRYQKTGPGKWVLMAAGKKSADHPVEADHQKRHAAISGELDARKRGEKAAPTFNDRAKTANERHQSITTRETELNAKEHDVRTREMDAREKELQLATKRMLELAKKHKIPLKELGIEEPKKTATAAPKKPGVGATSKGPKGNNDKPKAKTLDPVKQAGETARQQRAKAAMSAFGGGR